MKAVPIVRLDRDTSRPPTCTGAPRDPRSTVRDSRPTVRAEEWRRWPPPSRSASEKATGAIHHFRPPRGERRAALRARWASEPRSGGHARMVSLVHPVPALCCPGLLEGAVGDRRCDGTDAVTPPAWTPSAPLPFFGAKHRAPRGRSRGIRNLPLRARGSRPCCGPSTRATQHSRSPLPRTPPCTQDPGLACDAWRIP